MKQPRIILHSDMDSFFASIEVREQPHLEGKPVVVGADPMNGNGRGVVSTCSYEARKYGIHSAMPVSTAFRLCPEAIFLPVNFRLYREVSDSIMAIIRGYGEKFQQVSIDEAYLDVSGLGNYQNAVEVGKAIKREIYETEGLTCSVGIAPNKLVAKIASDFQKPDGMTLIEPASVRNFLAPLPVSRIPGIGKKTAAELNAHNITTIGQLSSYDIQDLMDRFGKWGLSMHRLAQGEDSSEVQCRGETKSIGRERTFSEDIADNEEILRRIHSLATGVHADLMKHRLRFKTLTVKIRYQGFVTCTRSHTLDHFTDHLEDIDRWSTELMNSLVDRRHVRLIGLRLSNFDRDRSIQTTLRDYRVFP